MSFWDITVARPNREYLPLGASGDALEAKMVDFCLTVSDLDVESSSRRLLQEAATPKSPLSGFPNRSINHTKYAPLTLRPISVSIKTKTPEGSIQEAKAQLSVWAASHLQRLTLLRDAKRAGGTLHFGEGDGRDSLALPLLLISGSVWMLFFAVDRADSIVSIKNLLTIRLIVANYVLQELLETITIGDTKTLLGCFKVVAALRELASWSEGAFRDWLLENVL